MARKYSSKKKNRSKAVAVDVTQKIQSAALKLVDEANKEFSGLRSINRGTTLEVVRRSLRETEGLPFSQRQHQALSDVSHFIALAQRNKIIEASAKNTDLLPIAHPFSSRSHNFSVEDLRRARARWVADDPAIQDEETKQFVVTALCASAYSPAGKYAFSRLMSLPPGALPQSVLVAISSPKEPEPLLAWGIPGVNVSSRVRRGAFRFFRGGNSRTARSARARRQRRDRKGRFAFMGAALLFFLTRSRGGRKVVSALRGFVVGQPLDSNTFDVEISPGDLIRVPANKSETVKAVLKEDLTGRGGQDKVTTPSADETLLASEIQSIEAPYGFSKDESWSPPKENVDYYGKNTDNGTLFTDEAYDVLKFDTANAQAKDLFEIAQQKESEGQDIAVLGGGEGGEIDESAPVFFVQRRDGSGQIFGAAQSWVDVQRLIGQDQKLFEKDEPSDPKSLQRWEEDNPEGESIDDLPPEEPETEAGDEGGDEEPPVETPSPAEESERPDGLYEVDRGEYSPQGARDGVESEDYTDDPAELAQRFDSEELEGSLEEAVRNGEGEALLPFEDGDEYVPAEAMYNALKEQDRDPDTLLDDIYEGREREEGEQVAELPEADEEAEELEEGEEEPVTAEDVAADREAWEESVPELLRGLSDEELADYINDNDYLPYLPENGEFNVPEGMHELDSDPFPINEDLAPDEAPEGSPNTPAGLAVTDSEDLESYLREALSADAERLGYATIAIADEDGEFFEYDIPAEAIRDALQLKGFDTDELIQEIYDGAEEMEPEEVDSAMEGEGLESVEVFGLDQETKERLIAATKEGGYTVDFVTGDVPEDGYMVASEADVPDGEGGFSKREEVVSLEDFESDPERYVDEFVARNLDKLTQDGYYIGTWTDTVEDEETGEEREYVFFDVSERIEDKEEALQAARDRNEIAVFGLAEFEEFFTDPEREAQKNAEKEAAEGDDSGAEELPGDVGDGTPGVDEAGEPVDSGEPEEQEEVGFEERVYDTSEWTKTGGQAGSNEGGFFRDSEDNAFYVKVPKSEDHARNEVAASALYEAAGLNVGRVYMGRNADGDTVLVSPIIPDTEGELSGFLNDEDVIRSAYSGFATDAWLNNWDAVGLVYDNMLVKDGEVYRIDPGGSLFYRAQGAEKALPDDVNLIESLRNPDINQQSANIFGDMSDDDIRDSVAIVEGLSPEQISDIVDEIYADDSARGDELKEKLLARREWLIENYGGEAEASEAEEPEEVEEAEAPFGSNFVVLDFESELDLEEQIRDAFNNGQELVFSYDGTDRLVRPVGEPESNENTGNVNVLTVDEDGNYKKFTISKMEPAEGTPDLDEVDTPGEPISVDDAEISPVQFEETSKQIDSIVDAMYETENLTSTDVEDFGEGQDVNDDITDKFVENIDDYDWDADFIPNTPEEKILADSVQSVIDGDVEDIPSSVEDLVETSRDVNLTDPDIIWQEVLDSYNGKKLDNGHIVVSSTMHGNRRYDVVVRRQNDNTFHIYHRVTREDGSTKVKEMGGQGWHSSKALFTRIDKQIQNSLNSPKTTIDKNLKSENALTLYADTSTPKQPGSYVDANNDVIQMGDTIVVTNEGHSKFGMRGQVVEMPKLFTGQDTAESSKYLYTDYLRVQYEDGESNWIVSQSTTLASSFEGEEVSAPTKVSSSTEAPYPFATGTMIDSVQADTLPKGTVIETNEGLIRVVAPGVFVKHLDNTGMPAMFPPLGEGKIVSYDESYGKDAPNDKPPSPPVIPSAPPAPEEVEEVTPADDGDVSSSDPKLPASGTEVELSEEVNLHSNDDVNMGRLQPLMGTAFGQAFSKEYGVEGTSELNEFIQESSAPTDSGQQPFLPIDKVGYKIFPGVIVNYAPEGADDVDYTSFAVVTEVNNYDTKGDVDMVVITGPQAGKKFTNVSVKDLKSNTTFISRQSAKDSFNIDISSGPATYVREVKKNRNTPEGPYRSEEMVYGPGIEEPELTDVPSWDTAVAGANSMESVLNRIRNVSTPTQRSNAGDGLFTQVDGTAIEDAQVRVQRVVDSEGNVQLRITGKLTNWAGNNQQTRMSEADGDGIVSNQSAIRMDYFEDDDSGNLKTTREISLVKVDKDEQGTTYLGEYGNASISFYRALPKDEDDALSDDDKTVNFFDDPKYSNNPVSFHNLFDIRLPENASTEDIENALAALGVSSTRPATDIDLRNVAENKLLWALGNIKDGNRNPSKTLRQQELQKIQQKWGVTPDDVEISFDSRQGRVIFKLPDSVGLEIAERENISALYHNVDSRRFNESDITEFFANIFGSERLESTVDRHVSGDFVGGLSSETDVYGAGANYVFTYIKDVDSPFSEYVSPRELRIVLDPAKMLSRLDYYANRDDGWGQMKKADLDPLEEIAKGVRTDTAEVMFKGGIPMDDAVLGIIVHPDIRSRLIQELSDRGIDSIGDKSLEEFFSLPPGLVED